MLRICACFQLCIIVAGADSGFEVSLLQQSWTLQALGAESDSTGSADTPAQRSRKAAAEARTHTHTHTDAIVRVYVYDAPTWNQQCSLGWFPNDKVLPDKYLHEALLAHPWRTHKPEEADVFFVPALLSASVWDRCGDHWTNMAVTAAMLNSSTFFHRKQGFDHVISGHVWDVTPGMMGQLSPLMVNMIVATQDHRQDETERWPRAFWTPYAPVSDVQGEADEWAVRSLDSRPHSLFLVGQADYRRAYRSRRAALRTLPAAFPDAILIQAAGDEIQANSDGTGKNHGPGVDPDDPPQLFTPLPRCTESGNWSGCIANYSTERYIELGRSSKFTLMIGGDSASSSRLYDAAQFGHVLIIISDGFKEQAMTFPQELPWQDFSVFIGEDDFVEDPVGQMQEAVAAANHSWRQRSMVRARSALDWNAPGHCIGAAVLTHVARHFLGHVDAPPALQSSLCPQ